MQKASPGTRLPDELRTALREEAYRRAQATGKEPSWGALLWEAWQAFKSNPQNYDKSLVKSDDPPEIHAGKSDSRKKPSQMADDALISFGASGTGGTNKSDPQGDPSGMASDIRALKERLASVEARIARRGKGDGAAGKRKQS